MRYNRGQLKGVIDMSRNTLRNIVSILMESPLYRTLSRNEKRFLIKGLTENYSFLGDTENGEIVGYESSWAGCSDSGNVQE